jgi:hypothetical protein
MPLIIGYNISPLEPHIAHSPDQNAWRDALYPLLETVTCEFWDIKAHEVSCFFPHDPSVPTNPYPVATLVVDLLFNKPERTLERRNAYAKALAETCRDYLNKLRGTTDAKVEVAIKPFDPEKNGFYMTP